MADRYLLESGAPDGYQLEDGSGVLLLEGGAVVVDAGLGEVTYTGFAPTVVVSDNQTVNAGLGEVTYTGFAPTVSVSDNQTVNAGVGAVVYEGFAPTVEVSGEEEAPDVYAYFPGDQRPPKRYEEYTEEPPEEPKPQPKPVRKRKPKTLAPLRIEEPPPLRVVPVAVPEPVTVSAPIVVPPKRKRATAKPQPQPQPVTVSSQPGEIVYEGFAPEVHVTLWDPAQEEQEIAQILQLLTT